MNILNLTVIAQLCVFYFYVLVSFQRQLRRERRRSRGTTIPLNFIDKQLRAVIHGSRSACESREFGSETESARSTVASLPGCNPNNVRAASRKFISSKQPALAHSLWSWQI